MIFSVVQQKGRTYRHRPAAPGLGLLGVVGLVAFLVILLIVVVAGASWVRRTGRQALTVRTLDGLAQALQAYRQEAGKFPPDAASIAQLTERLYAVEPSRKLLLAMPPHVFRLTPDGKKEILDAWGRPLRYVYDSSDPELFSDGQDADDRADDLYAPSLDTDFLDAPDDSKDR